MSSFLDALLTLSVVLAFIALGLALLSAKHPHYWKPVLEAYLEVLKVSAVLVLNCVYYSILAALWVVQATGGAIQRRKRSV